MRGWIIAGGVLLFLIFLLLCPLVLSASYEAERWTVRGRYLFFSFALYPRAEKKAKKPKIRRKKRTKKTEKPKSSTPEPRRTAKTAEGVQKPESRPAIPTVTEPPAVWTQKSALEQSTQERPVKAPQGHRVAVQKKTAAKKPTGNVPKLDSILKQMGFYATILRSLNKPLSRLLHRLRLDRIRLKGRISGEDAADTAIRYGAFQALYYSALGVLAGFVRLKPGSLALIADYDREEVELILTGSARARLPVWAAIAFVLGGGLRVLRAAMAQKNSWAASEESPAREKTDTKA